MQKNKSWELQNDLWNVEFLDFQQHVVFMVEGTTLSPLVSMYLNNYCDFHSNSKYTLPTPTVDNKQECIGLLIYFHVC